MNIFMRASADRCAVAACLQLLLDHWKYREFGYKIVLTSVQMPLSMFSSHTSPNTSLLLYPPTTSSSECCCPVRGPAIQQAAWTDLAGGLAPETLSLVQCCMKIHVYTTHIVLSDRLCVCIHVLTHWLIGSLMVSA